MRLLSVMTANWNLREEMSNLFLLSTALHASLPLTAVLRSTPIYHSRYTSCFSTSSLWRITLRTSNSDKHCGVACDFSILLQLLLYSHLLAEGLLCLNAVIPHWCLLWLSGISTCLNFFTWGKTTIRFLDVSCLSMLLFYLPSTQKCQILRKHQILAQLQGDNLWHFWPFIILDCLAGRISRCCLVWRSL